MSSYPYTAPISSLVYSGRNPRQEIKGLDEFAENIRQYGVLEPIIVRPREGKFEVVAGERRLRAAVKADLKEVPIIVRELTDRQSDELRLIENIHRDDLTGAEKGDGVFALLENYPEKYPTLESIARSLGKPYNSVLEWTSKSKKLSKFVKKAVGAHRLGDDQAHYLSKHNRSTQDKLARAIIRNKLTNTETRTFLKLYDKKPSADLDKLARKVKPPTTKKNAHRKKKPLSKEVKDKISKSRRETEKRKRGTAKKLGQPKVPEDVKKAVQERPELADFVKELSRIKEPGKRRRLIRETIKRLDAAKKEAIKRRLGEFQKKSEAMKAKLDKLKGLRQRGLILHTIWDFGGRDDYAGDKNFHGNCPPQIVEQCIWRLTNKKDLVLDPMVGTGTTIDVCRALDRNCIGYDIYPERSDIIQNDSRKIPLESDSVDMIFIHPPYWDLTFYSESEKGIPNSDLSRAPTLEKYMEMLKDSFRECHRVLKSGKYMCLLLGDLVKEGKFVPLCREAANRAEDVGFTDCGYAVKITRGEASKEKYTVIFAELAWTTNLKISHDLVMFFKKE